MDKKINYVPTERCAIDTDKFFNSSRNEEDNYPLYTIHECVYRVPPPVFQHPFPSEMEPWFFKDWQTYNVPSVEQKNSLHQLNKNSKPKNKKNRKK